MWLIGFRECPRYPEHADFERFKARDGSSGKAPWANLRNLFAVKR
jgi:hypothetical protein